MGNVLACPSTSVIRSFLPYVDLGLITGQLCLVQWIASLYGILYCEYRGGYRHQSASAGSDVLSARRSHTTKVFTPGQSRTSRRYYTITNVGVVWETLSTVRQLTMHVDYASQPEPSLAIVTFHLFSHSHLGVNRSYPIYGDPAIAQKRKQKCFGEPRVGGQAV